jgi:4-amino-4-deoxy-L-arabinose transferase-like glycosyltransferase
MTLMRGTLRAPSRLTLSSALFAVLIVWALCFAYCSTRLNKSDIWFSNLDQDSPILIDALRLNSGKEPYYLEHPGLGAFYLYAKMQLAFSHAGLLPISNFAKLAHSSDPLMFLPEIFYKGRTMSILLCIATGVLFGLGFYVLSRSLAAGVLASCLFLGSGGVLFQSLVVRTELSSTFFAVVAFVFLCLYERKISRPCDWIVLTLAGVALGISILTKIQAIPLLAFAFVAVGWLATRHPERRTSRGGLLSRLLFGAIPLCCWLLWIYFKSCFSGDAPAPALGAILVLIGATSLSLLAPRYLSPKAEAAAESLLLFVLGIVIAVPLVFALSSIDAASTRAKLLEMVFALRLPDYRTSLSQGFVSDVVGRQLVRFLSYYSLRSPQLPAFALVMVFAQRKARTAAIAVLSAGLLMCVVSSLRYYSLPYLIFSDFLFDAALMVAIVGSELLGSKPWGAFGSDARRTMREEGAVLTRARLKAWSTPEDGRRFHRRQLVRSLIVVALPIVLGGFNLAYVRTSYAEYNSVLRDRIDLVPYGVATSSEYHTMLVSRYGSTGNVLVRLFGDPVLNGTKDGIDLGSKMNIGHSYVVGAGRERSQGDLKGGIHEERGEGAWIVERNEGFDLVGPRETLGPDGTADGVVWLRIGPSCVIRALEIRCGWAGVWTTEPHTGAWALGVAEKAKPTALLNRSDGSVQIDVKDRMDLFLFLCDNGSTRREEGLDSVVVAMLGDGSRRFFPITRLR